MYNVLHGFCTSLYSHQQCLSDLVFLHLCQDLVLTLFFFFNGLLSLTVLSPISFLNQLLSRGNLLSIIFVPALCYTLSTGHLNSSVGSGLSSFSSTDGAAEAQRGWGICPGSHSWIWLSWYLDPGISDFQGLFLAQQATISGLDSRLIVLYTHTLKY